MTDVVIVHLRRPKRSDPRESRSDPFYEFGSFGITGCHRTNLLSDASATGRRLAFAQPGDGEFRLVYLTPPVRVEVHDRVREARWSPGEMPLRYEDAPVLVGRDGTGEIGGLLRMIERVNRDSPAQRFSSAFRSRKKPIPPEVAAGLVHVWEKAAAKAAHATHYWEALPRLPPNPDHDRMARYRHFLELAGGGPSPLPPTPTPATRPSRGTGRSSTRGNC